MGDRTESGSMDNTPRRGKGSEVRRREGTCRLREDTSRSIVGTEKIEDEGKDGVSVMSENSSKAHGVWISSPHD